MGERPSLPVKGTEEKTPLQEKKTKKRQENRAVYFTVKAQEPRPRSKRAASSAEEETKTKGIKDPNVSQAAAKNQKTKENQQGNAASRNKIKNSPKLPLSGGVTREIQQNAAAGNVMTHTFSPAATSAKPKRRYNSKGKGDKLAIIPLGGLGEVGKNMTAIKYGNNIVVIDAGMSFPDDDLLGIDLVIPDYNYLLENKAMVKAIALTHGHEDHIGALPYVLRDLNVPVYGGRLTIGLLKGKLREHGLRNVTLNEVANKDIVDLGDFKLEFIRVTHSIPDSFAIAVHTPLGIVLATGDYRLDTSPIDGDAMDFDRFAELGRENVILLMADSTNAENDCFTESEKSVKPAMENIFRSCASRIILTTFASNVHRVQQAIWAAEETGRKVAIVGRGMSNVSAIAMELGYLQVKSDTIVDIDEANKLPDHEVLVITTGSQGEHLSGLTLMSVDEHRQVHIRPGDVVVISANAIPGNEKMVARTVDNLFRHGANVVYGRGKGIHVSGHAGSIEMKIMLSLVKPKFFMPMHGEYRMLHRHRQLALELGMPEDHVFVMENGNVLELDKDKGAVIGRVSAGRILIDGLGVGDVGTAVLKDRKQLANDGIVVVTLLHDPKSRAGVLSRPEIISRGFVFERENEQILEEAKGIVLETCSNFADNTNDINAIKGSIRGNLSKFFYDRTGRRPIILPVIIQL